MVFYKRARRSARTHRRTYQNNGAIPPELKYLDTTIAETAIPSAADWSGCELDPTTSSYFSVFGPDVGDSATNRDGKHCVIKSIQMHGTIRYPQLSTATVAEMYSQPCIVALVLDKQTNNVQLNSENIFINNIAGAAPFQEIGVAVPFRNMDFAKRFKILKVWRFFPTPKTVHVSGANAVYEGCVLTFEFYTKCQIPVNFNAQNSGVIANILDNSLHVVANCCASGATVPLLAYSVRCRFLG